MVEADCQHVRIVVLQKVVRILNTLIVNPRIVIHIHAVQESHCIVINLLLRIMNILLWHVVVILAVIFGMAVHAV